MMARLSLQRDSHTRSAVRPFLLFSLLLALCLWPPIVKIIVVVLLLATLLATLLSMMQFLILFVLVLLRCNPLRLLPQVAPTLLGRPRATIIATLTALSRDQRHEAKDGK